MSNNDYSRQILAIVSTKRDSLTGGIPIFFCASPNEQEEMAQDLARALRADVVKLIDGTQLILSIQR